MLKKIINIVKFSVFILTVLIGLRYGGSISINIGETSIDFHIVTVILIIGVLYFFYSIIKSAFQWCASIFSGKSDHEKGLENLQLAFFKILQNDKSPAAVDYIKKAKKYLGELPIISWLDGHQHLANGNDHLAKAIFYGLCEREKQTAFGAFSLYKLAMKEKSNTDALNAIRNIIKTSPNSNELNFSAITISLKNKNFEEAKKYISSIKNTKNGKIVEAIVLSEEGFYTNNTDLLEKTFKLDPGFSQNALRYADHLIKNGEIKDARYILLKSFKISPNMDVFNKYVFCEETLSNLDRLKIAEKLVVAAPFSWVGYFGLGKLALEEGMLSVAFQNLLKAYKKDPYDFIAEKLIESAKLLNDPKPQEALNVLAHPLASKQTNFAWECKHCGQIKSEWIPICDQCYHIGEYGYVNLFNENDTHSLNNVQNTPMPDTKPFSNLFYIKKSE